MTPRLFLSTFGIETRKLMSYRVDFWLSAVIGFVVHVAIAFFLWRAIFDASGSERVGGYDFESMVLYYVLVSLFGKVVRGPEFPSDVSQDIYEGGLSRYLVYPTNYFLFRYAQHLGNLAPALVQLALFGTLCPIVLAVPDGFAPGFGAIAGTAAALLVGNALHYLLMLPVQLVAFWADNVWSLAVMMRLVAMLLGGFLVPLSLFPGGAEEAARFLPFPYLFHFPVEIVMGRLSPLAWAEGMGIALAWCGVLALVSSAVWQRGKLVYSGVGI